MGERLNLGCGGQVADGWVNLDVQRPPGSDEPAWRALRGVEHDALRGLPFDDGAFEIVVAHHVLDLFDWGDLLRVLGEVRRVCAGTFRASAFDPRLAIEAVWHSDTAYFDEVAAVGDTYATRLMWVLTLNGARRSCLIPDLLHVALAAVGFTHIERAAYQRTNCADTRVTELDSRPIESFYVDAS